MNYDVVGFIDPVTGESRIITTRRAPPPSMMIMIATTIRQWWQRLTSTNDRIVTI